MHIIHATVASMRAHLPMVLSSVSGVLLVVLIIGTSFFLQSLSVASTRQKALQTQLSTTQKALSTLKAEDQYVINQKLSANIKSIETSYKKATTTYENIVDLHTAKADTKKIDAMYAQVIRYLSEKNYASAEAVLKDLDGQIAQLKQKAQTGPSLTNVVASNTAPGSGYTRQLVHSDVGDFVVDLVAGNMSSTRVIVDTASEGDCKDGCPVLSLGDYVSRNGAYAGINGSYFCPAEYPSCVGKTNSFDTLLMNKNKKYFNSDNNVYSTVPAVIFQPGSMRFVGQSLEWGRDTGVDGVIANQPLLIAGGNVIFGGSGDPKQGSKGSRSFVGNKGSIAYIGVVHNATVAEVAHVLKALGLDNALNLDSGGSTALWSGGYKVGPGRNIPNAILFVNK